METITCPGVEQSTVRWNSPIATISSSFHSPLNRDDAQSKHDKGTCLPSYYLHSKHRKTKP